MIQKLAKFSGMLLGLTAVLAGCGGSGGGSSTTIPAPTVTITASPTSVTTGQSSTLTVTATNSTQVVISDNVDTNLYTLPAAGGTQVVTPSATTTYTATASGTNGSTAVATVKVTVTQPVPTVSLSASPATVFAGQVSTLTWSSTNATSVSIAPTVGSVALSGNSSVSPIQTTTYTATATGNGQQVTATATVTVSPVNSFDGLAEGAGTASQDVDPNGAVGTKQFMEYVNTEYQAYAKSPPYAAVWSVPQPIGTPWQNGNIAQCSGADIDLDAVILFDRLASRWVIAGKASTGGTAYYYCIAVSNTDDLSSASLTWYAYVFNLTPYLTNGSTVYLPDWAKLATWPDAYYVTIDMFDTATVDADVGVFACALDRTDMLLGQTMLTPQCFPGPDTLLSNGIYLGHSLIPADVDGTTAPPAGRDEYMVSIENPTNDGVTTTSDTINLWDFHVDWTTPANSSFTLTSPSPTVITYTPGCYLFVPGFPAITNCVPEPAYEGTGQHIDSVGDRFMPRFSYRNFINTPGYESFLISHTVQTANNSQNALQTGVRWYELRDTALVTPSVYQAGTINPDNTVFRFLPSIAQDQDGNAAVGYSVSDSFTDPGINFSYWSLATPNAPSYEVSILNGNSEGEEITPTTGNGAWGTYSSMTVDPEDDCTFWYVNEYWPSGNASWATRIAYFKMPTCPAAQ
jgi:hypothetical protein